MGKPGGCPGCHTGERAGLARYVDYGNTVVVSQIVGATQNVKQQVCYKCTRKSLFFALAVLTLDSNVCYL
jgi:hypothetical protein